MCGGGIVRKREEEKQPYKNLSPTCTVFRQGYLQLLREFETRVNAGLDELRHKGGVRKGG